MSSGPTGRRRPARDTPLALLGKIRGFDEPFPSVRQSIRNCLAIVSRIYNEQPKALHLDNPVAGQDRADRDSIGPAWDPKAERALVDVQLAPAKVLPMTGRDG